MPFVLGVFFLNFANKQIKENMNSEEAKIFDKQLKEKEIDILSDELSDFEVQEFYNRCWREAYKDRIQERSVI